MNDTERNLIKIYLNRISYNYPEIPKVPDSEALSDAVEAFRRIFGISGDNDTDDAVIIKIKEIYSSIKKLSELYKIADELEGIPAQFPGELHKGSEGESVKLMQLWLSAAGIFYPSVPEISITGSFDEETENALKAFQHVFELNETGRADRISWHTLYRAYKITVKAPDLNDIPHTAPFGSSILREGISDRNVRILQEYINLINESLGFSPILKETGYFGALTAQAVSQLQQLLGLSADGIVNHDTWNAISELYSDIILGNIKKPFQFAGYTIEENAL